MALGTRQVMWQVYIHGLVRDEQKQKMSKTRGNVIDPLKLCDEHGTDAVRFTLAIMASPGTDIPLDPERMKSRPGFSPHLRPIIGPTLDPLVGSSSPPWVKALNSQQYTISMGSWNSA